MVLTDVISSWFRSFLLLLTLRCLLLWIKVSAKFDFRKMYSYTSPLSLDF